MVGCCIMVRVFELDKYFDCLPQRNLTINLIDLKEQIKFCARIKVYTNVKNKICGP